MTIKPLGTGPAAIASFALIDSLIRRLVAQGTLTPEGAADTVRDTIANLRKARISDGNKAIPFLEEVFEEYRKHTR